MDKAKTNISAEKRLDVKMPTVTSMLKNLSKRKLVHYEKYEYVELTDKGSEVGGEVHRKHMILRRFLTDVLNIDLNTADKEACKMEHALSVGTLDSMTDFMAFIQACPRVGEDWLERFEEYRREPWSPDKCVRQSEQFSCEFMERTASLERDRSSREENFNDPP
ncbi:MAG: metal-dependent transcriptional regulator [Deltaproteobacteria bacterium]|nr:metal-dependent transcriptional regulator [Deltaproteobacteria bacterium]